MKAPKRLQKSYSIYYTAQLSTVLRLSSLTVAETNQGGLSKTP